MDTKNLQLEFIPKNQVKSHFVDDLPSVWGGNWYVDSEIGKLRKVLMRRPGREIENLQGDPKELSLCGPLNPAAMREEFDQLVKVYRDNGIEVNLIRVDLPHNDIHLDGMMGIADYNVVLLNTDTCPEHVYLAFRHRGFNIVEAPRDEIPMAANFVALEPGKIVMCKGYPKTKALLEAQGVTCLEVCVDNIIVAAGAIHCMTAFLERDPVPLYKVYED